MMKKKALLVILVFTLLVCLVPGSAADKRPHPKQTPTGPVPQAPAFIPQPEVLASLNEGFDDITNLPGWVMTNNSDPVGFYGWIQGDPDEFPAQAGAPNSYIMADYNSTMVTGTISNWLLTPELTLYNGSELTFWTRTVVSPTIFPDRLQVRLSLNGASTNVGTLATDVGDFTTLLLDINPTLVEGGYPVEWTQYSVTLTGIPAAATGRIAFRYFVTDGGAGGLNSYEIGIDSVVLSPILFTHFVNIPLVFKDYMP